VEEFLVLLFEEVLGMACFIPYSNNTLEYTHSICLPNTGFQEFRTVQRLVEESFDFLNLKLVSVPDPIFILQMPFCDGKLVNGSFIIPNLTLNVGALLTSEGTSVHKIRNLF
jgi:hypothetical protein